MGLVDEAREAWREALAVNPAYSLEQRRNVMPYKNPADFERIVEGLRKAGFPRDVTATRKLAAILAADVVGYSRLAGADEDRTLARLRTLAQRSDRPDDRRPPRPRRQAHRRRAASSSSAASSTQCAALSKCRAPWSSATPALRRDQRIEFRIGIHLGDVVEEADGDLMGDGVNIAARLESICRARRHLPLGARLRAGARPGEGDLRRSRREDAQEHRAAGAGLCDPDRGGRSRNASGRARGGKVRARRASPSSSCLSPTWAAIPSRSISSTA